MGSPETVMTVRNAEDCRKMSRALQRWIIEQSHASNVGHISSALSITDLISAVWGGVMKKPGTTLPDRDRFILSKGHAALCLYAAMRWSGVIDGETYNTYCGEGSVLGVHPDCALEGIDLSTGSLGHGLSVACGLALGFRKRNLPPRVFILLSDAECNEGQVWEAAIFAAHHKLSNLTAVIDLNGLQAFGRTRDVLDLNQPTIWRAFGWDVREVDGHNLDQLLEELAPRALENAKPRVLIARTVGGHGVSFMEDQVDWHYRTMTEEQAAQALRELETPT
jgi:transketolase